MVFCYKIITETPRRSGSVSPRSRSPERLAGHVWRPEGEEASVLDAIPEREWRLLAALARRRREDAERDLLADQFHRLWERERADRDQLEAESGEQYRQYLRDKRAQERAQSEWRRLQLSGEQRVHRGRLVRRLQHEEARAQELRASRDDRKASEVVERALQEEARAALAAERRGAREDAERARRELQLAHAHQRANHAAARRRDLLTHSAKRLAISNALSSWESSLARHEVQALQAARRAQHAARAALAEERADTLARARKRSTARARRLAALTAQLRAELRAPTPAPTHAT